MSQSEAPDTRPVAFFDFDGTLTTGDTMMPFLKFVVGTPTYYAKLALVSPVLGAYFTKLLRNDIAKQIVLKQYLAGYHIDELFTMGDRFSREVIPSMLRPEGMEYLKWHQEQGHTCILVSASMDVYLQSWAQENGFSYLISSRLKKNDLGIVTGDLHEENCFGEEKKRKISDWLVVNPAGITFAYGDTPGDMPMLRLVNNGSLLKNGVFCKISDLGKQNESS